MEIFSSSESGSGDTTCQLVEAASAVLDAPAEQVLIRFGEHRVRHTAQVNFGRLMLETGKTLPAFLRNLPNFHARVALIFPKLQPARFECTGITDCGLKQHSYSHRSSSDGCRGWARCSAHRSRSACWMRKRVGRTTPFPT